MVDARLIKRFPARAEAGPFTLDIHLRAAAGITVLFGPSGAGKTLTLNCLAGFARPDEGRILVHDELFFDGATDVQVPPQRRHCGYLFQDHALFPHMTVRGNLQFAANARRRGRLNRHRTIQELLEAFELSDFADRKPAQLSGGQKQRAAIARMLVGEPRLLLMDEPARGLDARLRSAFHEVLQKTRERLQAPIILVTHDLEECFEIADTVCLMEDGKILQCGLKEQLFDKPVSVESARSLGIYNILPAEILALDPSKDTSKLRVLEGDLEGPYLPGHLIGDQGWLCFRRFEATVSAERSKPPGNQMAMRLKDANPSPRGVRLCFEHGVWADMRESDFADVRGRERLWLGVPRSAVYFLGK